MQTEPAFHTDSQGQNAMLGSFGGILMFKSETVFCVVYTFHSFTKHQDAFVKLVIFLKCLCKTFTLGSDKATIVKYSEKPIQNERIIIYMFVD